MNIAANDRTVKQDFQYYLPRWIAFGLLGALLLSGPVTSPNLNGLLPDGYYWRVILYQRIPMGIVYGAVAGMLFIAFQRLWNTNSNRVKWYLNFFLAIGIAKLTVLGIDTFTTPLMQQALMPKILKHIEGDSQKDFPTAGYSDAVRQESMKKSDVYMASSDSEKKKVEFAIGTFYGFYFINVRTHVEYCKSLGVDISSFTDAFIDANKDAHQLAFNLLSRNGVTEKQLYQQLSPSLTEMNRKNFDDIAAHD